MTFTTVKGGNSSTNVSETKKTYFTIHTQYAIDFREGPDFQTKILTVKKEYKDWDGT